MSSKTALLELGYENKGMVECAKCHQQVEMLEKDGKIVFFNSPEHPIEPGVLHEFSCGQQAEDHSLPPIPDQSSYVRS